MAKMRDSYPKKILFIMSSIKRAKDAEKALQKAYKGMQFVHATRSAEAIARFESKSFDMIICDYYMPNLTGLDILKNFRKKDKDKPFILLVDYQSQGVIIDALKKGANDTIIIDVAFQEILPVIVEKNLSQYRMRIEYEELKKNLEHSDREMKGLNVYDELTELWNRRYTVKKLEEESARCKRYNRPLSVLLIDIDHFSEINRNFGKEMGDIVLQKISSIMKQSLRKVDITGRYSGDEFLVILPETPVEKASVVAGKILDGVSKHTFRCKGADFKVTLSIGISWYPRFGREDYEEMLSSAGKALFRAKNEGYNRLKVAGKFG